MTFMHDEQQGYFSDIVGDDANCGELRIVVLGTGGAGCNTVNRLGKTGLSNTDFIACNTDVQDLRKIQGNVQKLLIGFESTKGLGAGGYPEKGAESAKLSKHEIRQALDGTNLLFLCAGMGGGTGTGSAPVIAEIAKDLGAVVVSVVSYPFKMERSRMKKAEEGILRLQKNSDTVIVVDNNKLIEYVPHLPIDRAFLVADEIVARAVSGITQTLKEPSLINLDFADLRSILCGGNLSVICVGDGEGKNRVEDSVRNTLTHPLLDVDFKGASGALIHISGGPDLCLREANQVGDLIVNEFDEKANIIWGARVKPNLENRLELITVASGVHRKTLFKTIEVPEEDEFRLSRL